MDDTEFLLPSEIARLVYGHLRTTCEIVGDQFLNTSPHLRECLEIHKRNLTFGTTANGLTLEEILSQFLNIQKQIFAAAKNLDESKRFNNVAEAFDFILQSSDETKGDDEVYEIISEQSSSCEETSSVFSLNIKTPPKKTRRRQERSAADDGEGSSQNLRGTINRGVQERRNQVAEPQTTPNNHVSPAAAANNRLCNTDGVRRVRRNSEYSFRTPSAKPAAARVPFTETKVSNYSETVDLCSASDTECETPHPIIQQVRCRRNVKNTPFASSSGAPVRKTIKTLKPRKPATGSVRELPVLQYIDVESIKIPRSYGSPKRSKNETPQPPKTAKRRSTTCNEAENCDRSSSHAKHTTKNNDVDVSIFKEKLPRDAKFLARFTDTINKVINSPQKKNYTSCSEELDKVIQEVIHETERSLLIDDILNELGLTDKKEQETSTQESNFASRLEENQNTSNLTENGSICNEITETNATGIASTYEVSAKVPQDRMGVPPVDNSTTVKSSVCVAQSIGSYISCPTDIMSPEKNTHDGEGGIDIIRLYPVESDMRPPLQSPLTAVNENATAATLDSSSIVIPMNKAIPLYQLYSGAASMEKHHNLRKTKFIPIAPRPNGVQFEIRGDDANDTENQAVKKRRSRTAKR